MWSLAGFQSYTIFQHLRVFPKIESINIPASCAFSSLKSHQALTDVHLSILNLTKFEILENSRQAGSPTAAAAPHTTAARGSTTISAATSTTNCQCYATADDSATATTDPTTASAAAATTNISTISNGSNRSTSSFEHTRFSIYNKTKMKIIWQRPLLWMNRAACPQHLFLTVWVWAVLHSALQVAHNTHWDPWEALHLRSNQW